MGYNEPMKKVPPQIRWGRDNEDRARQCYIENRQQCGVGCTSCLTEVLLDGKVLCRNVDTCSRGCLEIKCPYSINAQVTVSMSPTEIANKHPDFYMKIGDDNLLHLPPTHTYYAQVQG